MIIPVRCFSCGTVVASYYEEFVKRYEDYKQSVSAGEKPKETPKQILDSLGLERYCCRRMIIAHVDLLKEVSPYE